VESAEVDLRLFLRGHGGNIEVMNSGESGGDASVHFHGGFTSDTIDLSGFTGNTHLAFDRADASSDIVSDWTALDLDALHISGLDSGAGLDLSFVGYLLDTDPTDDYQEQVDRTTSVTLEIFQIEAENAIENMGAYFYFGVVGGNGILAYDFNNAGITGLIEMAGVTDFDLSQIYALPS